MINIYTHLYIYMIYIWQFAFSPCPCADPVRRTLGPHRVGQNRRAQGRAESSRTGSAHRVGTGSHRVGQNCPAQGRAESKRTGSGRAPPAQARTGFLNVSFMFANGLRKLPFGYIYIYYIHIYIVYIYT